MLSDIQHRPVHAWGQNFLLDLNVIDKIIAAAKTGINNQTKSILEIGPGLGILTQELITVANEKKLYLIAVERDYDLANRIIKRWGKTDALKVIKEDIVRFKRADSLVDGQFVIAANLPFQVTNFVLNTFLTEKPRPSKMVLMVQKEMADRLLAKAGDSARSPLSCVCEYYADAERVVEVPRTSFWPEPKVDASVVALTIKKEITEDDLKLLSFIKRSFRERRKKLGNTLSINHPLSKDEAAAALTKAKIDPTQRAQELTLKQWQDLADIVLK